MDDRQIGELLRELAELRRQVGDLTALTRSLVPTSGARVYNSAAISLTTATLTNLTFDSERFDTDGYHSTSLNTGRLTAPVNGLYLIAGNIRYASNATGERRIAIALNAGSPIGYQLMTPLTGQVTIMAVATIYQLSAGDYVTLQAYQSSGGALNVDAIPPYSPEFMIARL